MTTRNSSSNGSNPSQHPHDSDTLEITIGTSSASVDSAISLLEQQQQQQQQNTSSIKSLVVTFGGTATGRNRFGRTPSLQQQQQQQPPPPPPPLLSNTDLMRLFQALATACCSSSSSPSSTKSNSVEQLRLEWNIIAASFDEQPPLIPLQALGQLLSGAKQLQSLELYRLKLVGDTVQDYPHLTRCALQNTALQTVRVEFCAPLASPNLDALVLSFSKLPQVQDLEVIGFQGDSSRGCTSASLQSLCQDTKSLRTLKIWGGILQSEDPQAVAKLSEALKTNTNIQDLEIGLFDLDVESATALGDALRDNATLERIWLDVDSSLTQDTMTPLANAMKTNTSIKSFNIVSTKDPSISDNVLRILAEMTQVNTHLMHLTVRGSNESLLNNNTATTTTQSHYRTVLNFYLKLNRVGRQELLAGRHHHSHNNHSCSRIMAHHKWMTVLACENNNVSVTFFLLQHNPQFISQFVSPPPPPSSIGTTGKKRQLHLNTTGLQPLQGRHKRRKVIALSEE